MSESDTADQVDGNDTPLAAHPDDAAHTSSVGARPKFVRPNVHPPEKFHPSGKNAAQDWKMWRQMWDNYCILTDLNSQEQSYQKALLLHCLGPEGIKVYNGMNFAPDEDCSKAATILKKLDAHFLGSCREYFERFQFNRRDQHPGESIEEYISVLRNMSKTCGFCKCMSDKLLMDRLLLGVRDRRMQESLMAIDNLTLTKAIDICKAMEAASTQLSSMRREVHAVDKRISHKSSSKSYKANSTNCAKKSTKDSPQHNKKILLCKFCCRKHEMKKEMCPAWGQRCNACKKPNHFSISKLCPANTVNLVEEDSNDASSSAESVSCVTHHAVNCIEAHDGPILCNMIIHDERVQFQIDSGSTVNLLPKRFLTSNDEIREEVVKLEMWNKSTLQALGKCKVKTRNPATGKKYKVDYVIVEDDLRPLISKTAAEKMDLIKVNYDSLELVNNISLTHIPDDYPDVFSSTRVGTLPGSDVHLTLMDDAKPCIKPARTIPESLKTKVKKELDMLESRGVIEEITSPTDWVSQMAVVQKKNGEVRLCLDPRPLNVSLKREHYPLPVLDDILPQLSNSTVFSICDLKNGYLHCPLDEQSSLLTTFATPWGRYKWKRLPFGLKVSSEIFQKRLLQALDGLTGVQCVADDIIIWGSSDAEHDERLHKLLQRCQSVGIVLNKEKCQYRLKEITFLGHIVSSSGLKPDPCKVEAIVNMEPPTCKDDVHRLRGMVNYLARYLPKLTEVMQPLNNLTHKNVVWNWDANCDKAFQELKDLLITAPVLSFYDEKKELVIHTDASAGGLGAVMMQDGRPIAYASRALSDTETRYSVIEKEMLGIVFALEKWNQYTFGREVIVYTDHKPLESICCKPLDRAPKRLQGMLLRALAYDIEVCYLKGKDNLLADTLSRATLPYAQGQEDLEKVNAVNHLTLPEQNLQEMRDLTAEDPSLQALKQTILDGWPEHRNQLPLMVKPYFNFRDELSVQDGLIFRGERLIVPKAMRPKVKEDLHIGHNGIDGTLRRAREYLYWPQMTKEITEWIETCEVCMEHCNSQSPQPLMSHALPDRPWEKIGVDLFSFEGAEYMVTVCYKSNFWELDKLSKTTAGVVISKLKHHFARYGLPDVMVSDNGPPFQSHDFSDFTTGLGIQHQTISPYNSKANGKAESAVKTAKRMLKKCRKSGEDQCLALLNIRNTPTQGVDSSPVQRFLGRRTKTKLPTTHDALKPMQHQSKHEMQQLMLNQKRQAHYFNKHSKPLSELDEGDVVRMKPFRLGDDKWKKATVLRRLDERSYEVIHHNQVYRRNREHLRSSRESPDLDSPVFQIPDPEATPSSDSPGEGSTSPSRTSVTREPRSKAVRANPNEQPGRPAGGQPFVRRSTRQRREPKNLADYVKY